MNDELDEKIEGILIGIMADAFNRSMNALEKAGAINRKEMMTDYKGIGSKYYDLVTEQFEYTAHYTKVMIRDLIKEENNKH